MNAPRLVLITALVCVCPLAAQETTTPETGKPTPTGSTPSPSGATQPMAVTQRVFRSEVRVQRLMFGNFFQAPSGSPETTVNAIGIGYRGIYRPTSARTDYYGDISTSKYTNITRARPYSVRLGIRHEDNQQTYEVYAEHGGHRAAFDVGNRTAIGSVTDLNGTYARNISKDWQVGVNAAYEKQQFDVRSTLENTYVAGGVAVRFRGFGYQFVPEAGYDLGTRDVEDRVDSYKDHAWHVGFAMIPFPKSYFSLTYRGGARLYDRADAISLDPTLFASQDRRPQWSSFGAYRFTNRLGASYYWSRDASRSDLAFRRYTQSFLIGGLTVHF